MFAAEKTSRVDDERVVALDVLPSPEQLIRFLPVASGPIESFIAASRKRAQRIVHGTDDRPLVVIGPCSVHDPRSALAASRHSLRTGAQAFKAGVSEVPNLVYGQSITDVCLGWDDSVLVIRQLAAAVRARRVGEP